ncbi:MAG: hypothetical protein ACYTEZ_12765 [Planctomycetota bacterium]|jgi:uncharacterized phage infection (PIP) family protein YhgE
MEPKTGKESVVARLFGFGRKRREEEEVEETGFARTDEAEDLLAEEVDEPRVTIPEQVIRVRTPGRRRKDELITAISDSFRELTSLLGSVSDRLDRQDQRSVDLADQLKDLPDYLRALPRLQEEQTGAVRDLARRVADSAETLRRLPETQEEQNRAVHALSERMAEGTEAVHGVADALARIPEELRERSQSQEEAIRQVASAQQQTAKVIYAGHQKSLQLFHQATQKTLLSVHKQKQQMEDLLDASVLNMKRMFILAAAFMGAAVIAVVGLVLFR